MKANRASVAWSTLAILLTTLSLPTKASKAPVVSLEDMIAASSAIIRAQVEAVDHRNGELLDGKTRVDISITEVLRGNASVGTAALTFVGGEMPDGDGIWPSGVPKLESGESYILFLQDRYYLSPVLAARDAVLRVVRIGSMEVLADRDGLGLTLTPTQGLIRGHQVSKPVDSLANKISVATAPSATASKPSAPRGGLSVSSGSASLTSPAGGTINPLPPSSVAEFVSFVRARSKVHPQRVGGLPSKPLPSEFNFPPQVRRQ